MAFKVRIPDLGKRLARAAVVGYCGVALVLLGLAAWQWSLHRPHPPQPIEFPHSVHAGRLGLECNFCHVHVMESPRAGLPSLEKCMSCHRNVAVDRPGIRKLTQHYEDQRPLVWNRVHALPDHVYFTHKRHVRAGVACFVCHGNMRMVTTARQVRSLEMGWCVSCHLSRGASRDCAVCHR